MSEFLRFAVFLPKYIRRFRKKRGLVVMLVLLTACGGLLVLHEVQGQVGDVALSVVTYNIGTLNGEKPRLAWVVKAIRKKGVPDLVLLQEIPGVGGQWSGVGNQGGKRRWLQSRLKI